MNEKKPRSKTIIFIVIVTLTIVGLAAYYVAAIMNSDNRPKSVESQSMISLK